MGRLTFDSCNPIECRSIPKRVFVGEKESDQSMTRERERESDRSIARERDRERERARAIDQSRERKRQRSND